MSDLVIVDTDILIDTGRGIEEAIECLEKLGQLSSLSISVVTQMELIIGCRNKSELKTTERFLSRFESIKLTEKISDTAFL